MSHRADRTFFNKKRVWSKRKDKILGYYLEPYLAKVRRIGRPVLLVDGFAGPGKFGDDERGSPLIMCAKALAANSKPGPLVRVLCIESHPELYQELSNNLSGFAFANSHHGDFLGHVDRIVDATRAHSVLVYIDPYTAADIEWGAIESLAEQIRSRGASVEVLLNFNTPSFVRWGLAALARDVPVPDDRLEDLEAIDADELEPPNFARLSGIVGGDWWRAILEANQPFEKMIGGVAKRVTENIGSMFGEAGSVAIKQQSKHLIPKYHMVFGSRHPDAIELMNDAMVTARGASDFQIDLFADEDADKLILKLASDWVPRGQLILATIRSAFCQYFRKEIRGRIEALLKAGRLESESGEARINDSVRVRQPH